MPATVPEIDLEPLVELSDPQNRDVFLSLFADLTDPTHERALKERRERIRAALDGDERDGFDETWEMATMALEEAAEEPGSRGAAVFASDEHGVLKSYPLAQPVDTAAILDASPYVRPLARFLDHYEPFAVAILDTETCAVYRVEAATPELEDQDEVDLLGRHKAGGMSQKRFQRRRREAEHQFLQQVSEKLLEMDRTEGFRHLVLAGPGQAKRRLQDALPQGLSERVAAVVDVDFEGGPGDVLIERFLDAVRRSAEEDDQEALEALWAGLRRGELADVGALSVARAARNGRVETLFVAEGHTEPGAKCEAHDTLFHRGEACHCGDEGTEVDLVEEAVEYAVATDANVVFLDENERLEEIGGVGAVLRW